MASVNIVVIAGNVTREIEPRAVGDLTVADIGVAVNERFKGRDGQMHDRAVFVDVVAWGAAAENAAKYLRKGSPVLVQGRLQLDEWEKDGQKRSKLRVRADSIQFLERREKSAVSPAIPAAGKADDADGIPF